MALSSHSLSASACLISLFSTSNPVFLHSPLPFSPQSTSSAFGNPMRPSQFSTSRCDTALWTQIMNTTSRSATCSGGLSSTKKWPNQVGSRKAGSTSGRRTPVEGHREPSLVFAVKFACVCPRLWIFGSPLRYLCRELSDRQCQRCGFPNRTWHAEGGHRACTLKGVDVERE